MTDVVDEVPSEIALELPLGANELDYPELPKDVRIYSVKLRGMRNRLIAISRVRVHDITKLSLISRQLRGMPMRYAIDFKARRIYFWPSASASMTVILQTGDGDEDALAS